MIRAYHSARRRAARVIIVPDAAHGTNPATATMCGSSEGKSHGPDGDVDPGSSPPCGGARDAGIT